MGEKRQFHDFADQGGGGEPSTKRYKGGNSAYGDRQQQQHGHANHKKKKHHAAKPESSNWAKKRARDIERRLRNPESLPANVQRDLQRELASLSREIDGRRERKQRAQMIKKYHMLRFFERKKAMRLEKQLQRRLEAVSDGDRADRAAIEADLHIAHIDRLYAIYFPFMEPYVSLYPQSGDKNKREKRGSSGRDSEDGDCKDDHGPDEDVGGKNGKQSSSAAQALHAPRPPMWTIVEKTFRDGGIQALERLRDRQPAREDRAFVRKEEAAEDGRNRTAKMGGAQGGKKKSKKAESREQDSRQTGGRQKVGGRPHLPAAAVEDDDSDGGGFFEEE